MSFWSDPFQTFVKHMGGLSNSIGDNITPPEHTEATININQINFDVASKLQSIDSPFMEIIPDDYADLSPPPEVPSIISQIFETLGEGIQDKEVQMKNQDVTASVTTISFPDKNGHILVKIIEDATGKTIEIVHEATTIIPLTNSTETFEKGSFATTDSISNVFVESINSMNSKELYEPADNDAKYTDVYIITALVLLILMTMCIGFIVWCRKNKLKSVIRSAGDYPVITEYINNLESGKTEKLKNIP